MISYVTSLFKSINLSLYQWLIVTAAAVFGGLVIALRLEGSEVHRLQVRLLEETIDSKLHQQQAITDNLQGVYGKALKSYEDAGGKL